MTTLGRPDTSARAQQGSTLVDQKSVDMLERKLTQAIVEVLVGMGLKRLPLLPSDHTMRMMAKAAAAVYETAVENCARKDTL